MADAPDEVSFETREVKAEVKPGLTMYDPAVIDALEGRAEIEGEPRMIEYACGHELVQTNRQVTPGRCPECGGPLHD